MTENRATTRDARKLMKHLGIRYTHALRLLREGKWIIRGGVPQEVKEDEK